MAQSQQKPEPMQVENQPPTDTRVQPFLIERYSKNPEERNRERTFKKPKLGMRRLTDQKKLVPLEIDIPIDDNTIIKERFDWDLAKENVAPNEFVEELCKCLGLDKATCQKLKLQILSQIVEHIKNNTKRKKQEEKEFTEEPFARPLAIVRFNNEGPEQQAEREQNEKKKLSRQRRIDVMKRTPSPAYNPNQSKYFKEKKVCKHCRSENVTPGMECKNCKMPFQLLEALNLDDKRVKLSVKYYEKIANKIPLLMYEAREKKLEKEDFQSFSQIYTKIKQIFEKSTEVPKESMNQVRYIMEKYHEYFLHGDIEFNDDSIIFEKEIKKEPEDVNRVPRKRGRPRKVKIISEEFQAVPQEDNQSSSQSSESSEQNDNKPDEDQNGAGGQANATAMEVER